MRILVITGRYSYGDPNRGEGYESQNFLPALRRLGHEVELLDSLYRPRYENFIELNRAVLKKVEEWRPCVVLYVQVRYEIWTETWDLLRKSGLAATVNWAADDSWKYSQASRFLAAHFDGCVTTYADKIEDYQRDGCRRVMKSQWAADASRLQQPLPSSDCAYDVSFVGACYGNREKYVRELTGAGVRVACFGHGWPQGPIGGDEIAPTIRKSRISLNFSGSGKLMERFLSGRRQIKARVFEVPGAGGFLLSEWAPGIEQLYDVGREIDVFRTPGELLRKVQFYLANPAERDGCANAAHLRTVREHTYDVRLNEVLEFALAQHRQMPAGTGEIDWDAFERVAAQHQPNWISIGLRNVLVILCELLFGKRRGARAARRFVFEVCWRIAGEKTYSARGLPGRLFYHES